MSGARLSAFLPKRIEGLEELALNLWWSWHPAARMLFKGLDRAVWKESGHNPVLTLRNVDRARLEAAAADRRYLRDYDGVMSLFRRDLSGEVGTAAWGWNPGPPVRVAYFSAEYGLHHSLPFYAGGLGFLAGDFLKECSDLKIPLVAVGFMYPEGYVRQRLREDGWQENLDEPLDREAASIESLRDPRGGKLLVQVPFMNPPVQVAVWKVTVGRIPLYLLDTDVEANEPWNRRMAQHLYEGNLEQRLRQEIVLGLGGYEVLATLGLSPDLVHLNEGHSAFALLERARDLVASGADFQGAVERIRSTSLFTTHTPVPAGHDVFPFHLMEKYFGEYWTRLNLDRDSFMRLGVNPDHPEAGFNMTALALRLSGFHNGVSRKHGLVAGEMWRSLVPPGSPDRASLDYVTNGVHVPTWIEPKIQLLFNKYLGPDWLANHDDPSLWQLIDDLPEAELWQVHLWLKRKLFNFIVDRARKSWTTEGAGPGRVVAGGVMLDPSVLTLGFARRFATYKRADLILTDLDRLKKLVGDRYRPLQIIFAGKAHPADDPGKLILQQVYNLARNPALQGRVAVVEGYDEQLAQYLVHGVDVWLNNPLPPLEACGTSGMKAALNGVPSLSIADGWWLEGFKGTNGWSFGDGERSGDRTTADARELYDLLEKEVIPLYYQQGEDSLPAGWVKLMKEAIKSAAAPFSARRMVKEYADKFYRKTALIAGPSAGP